MKYLITACFIFTGIVGCGNATPIGPFPSPPMSEFFTSGDPQASPIGTRKPSTTDDEFVLTVTNEDDGGTSADGGTDGGNDVGGADTSADILVSITRVRDNEEFALVQLAPCQLMHAVIECMDRPVRLTVYLPDGTVATRLIPAGTTCFDREFFALRTTFAIPDADGDGEVDADPTLYDVYSLSETNSSPRCSGGGGMGMGTR